MGVLKAEKSPRNYGDNVCYIFYCEISFRRKSVKIVTEFIVDAPEVRDLHTSPFLGKKLTQRLFYHYTPLCQSIEQMLYSLLVVFHTLLLLLTSRKEDSRSRIMHQAPPKRHRGNDQSIRYSLRKREKKE